MQSEQKNALVEMLPTLTNETRAGRLCKKSRLGRKMHSISLPLQLDVSSECRPNRSTSARSLGPDVAPLHQLRRICSASAQVLSSRHADSTIASFAPVCTRSVQAMEDHFRPANGCSDFAPPIHRESSWQQSPNSTAPANAPSPFPSKSC